MERLSKEETGHIRIDYQLAAHGCVNSLKCRHMVDVNLDRLGGRYIGKDIVDPEKQVVAAILELNSMDYDAYISSIRKISKGAALRQAKKSVRQEYYCKPFARKTFIPDIVEINHSKPTRSGGKMKSSYLKTVEEMGGYPDKYHEFTEPVCNIHYDIWWGIFCSMPGHRQGKVLTDEKLLAYINLRRVGSYSFYSLILGHGDYLKDGVIYELHLNIMKWLLGSGNKYGKGLVHLMYAGFYQGGDGLNQWKKKFGFAPAFLWTQQKTGRQGLISILQKFRSLLRR